MSAAFWPVVVVGAFLVWVALVAVDLEMPFFLAKWYREPGNPIRAMTWIGSLVVVLITLTSEPDSFLGSLRTDAVTVAVTVIVIEELNRYRSLQEDKKRIIRQLGSRSNDFALEAARLIVDNGWSNDIPLYQNELQGANLQGANLAKANLQKVYLWGANLQESYLWGANLQEAVLCEAKLQRAKLLYANLQRANLKSANLQDALLIKTNLLGVNLQETILQGAMYTLDTRWPKGFDPKAVGAILAQLDEEKHEYVPVENISEKQAPLDGMPIDGL